jgi:hypothetical protein
MTACWLIFLTGAYAVWQAWQANRRTSLFHAVNWVIAAWVGWGAMMAAVLQAGAGDFDRTAPYLALCLTGCAGVGVLGARRPGAAAWNFVLGGLLAVLLLPLAESIARPAALDDPPRLIFLASTVAFAVLNYLPTRLAPAALALGLACAIQISALAGEPDVETALSWWLLAFTPWIAFACWQTRPRPGAEFDQVWLDYRDRFGFLWAQRVREQFNRSAANAGWPVVLRWHGLRLRPGKALPEAEVQSAIVATLRALLKRFGEDGEKG